MLGLPFFDIQLGLDSRIMRVQQGLDNNWRPEILLLSDASLNL